MTSFDEPTALNHVARFHEMFDLPVRDNPTIPAPERCQLRLALLTEELAELKQAVEAGDLVGAADAFADLQYVLSGAILEFGLGGSFKALFDEVQRSNMSKACLTKAEAEDTLQYYKESRGIEAKIVEKEQVFIVYRKEDGKVLKSVHYSEASLGPIVEEAQKAKVG